MKKISLFIAAVLLSSVLFAQDLPKLGIKGGLNYSNLVNDNGLNEFRKYKAGFHGGLLAHIHTGNKNFAIQPEVLYSLQGTELQTNPVQNINLHYINVPVLVQYMFDNGFRLETGPQVGALISAKSKYDGSSENINDEFKGGDFSWAFGLGYLSESGLGVDARYNLGISNINDLPAPNNAKLRNSVFQLGLFYMFDSRHKAKSR